MGRTTWESSLVFIPLGISLLPVCKLLSMELQEELSRTGRSREVLELGQVLDTGKRQRHVPYSLS